LYIEFAAGFKEEVIILTDDAVTMAYTRAAS
jgi:hypothetical protein